MSFSGETTYDVKRLLSRTLSKRHQEIRIEGKFFGRNTVLNNDQKKKAGKKIPTHNKRFRIEYPTRCYLIGEEASPQAEPLVAATAVSTLFLSLRQTMEPKVRVAGA